MGKNRWVVYLLLLMVASSQVACKLGGGSTRPAPARKETSHKRARKSLPPLPSEFSSMESVALELYHWTGNDRQAARLRQEKLKAEWRSLKPRLRKVKAPQDKERIVEMHLLVIEEAIKAGDRFRVAEHANELIGALQGLTRKFKTVVPRELILLQTDFREIELHAEAGDWTIEKNLLQTAKQDWGKFKAKTKKIGAEGVRKNLEGSLKELEAAVKAKDAGKARQIVGMIQSDLQDMRAAFMQAHNRKNKGGGTAAGSAS